MANNTMPTLAGAKVCNSLKVRCGLNEAPFYNVIFTIGVLTDLSF